MERCLTAASRVQEAPDRPIPAHPPSITCMKKTGRFPEDLTVMATLTDTDNEGDSGLFWASSVDSVPNVPSLTIYEKQAPFPSLLHLPQTATGSKHDITFIYWHFKLRLVFLSKLFPQPAPKRHIKHKLWQMSAYVWVCPRFTAVDSNTNQGEDWLRCRQEWLL